MDRIVVADTLAQAMAWAQRNGVPKDRLIACVSPADAIRWFRGADPARSRIVMLAGQLRENSEVRWEAKAAQDRGIRVIRLEG